jgi:CRISPR/Cas system-associated endonuclease/helicase Cas3
MRKVWEWLKKNWKYLLFPLWVVSLILVWVLSGGKSRLPPLSGTSDRAADDAMKAKDAAIQEFRDRLDALYEATQQRLQKASGEQLEEFKTMKDKPLDEVAKWIDKLS